MATMAEIQASIDATKAGVEAQTTVIDSVTKLLSDLVQKIGDLGAQIAALQAGTVTQAQIDAIAQEAADVSSALTQNTQFLSDAVAANTPVAPPAP